MIEKIKGVIFDLDGTLLDTNEDLASSVNAALKSFGYPEYDTKSVIKMVGNGFENLIDRAMPAEGFNSEEERANKRAEVLAFFKAHYKEHFMDETAPYPGIESLLKNLVQRGVGLAVNSNKHDDYTKALIKANFPDIPFVCVAGEQKGVPRKPDPTAALSMADMMSAKPEEVIYAGDSAFDIKTAINAGMIPLGVLWGFRDKEELINAGAKYIAECPDDIESVLK